MNAYPLSTQRFRSLLISFIIVLLSLSLVGCEINIDLTNNRIGSEDFTPGDGSQNVEVFVEPEAGEEVILDAFTSAQSSIWLQMYLISNTNFLEALEEAAQRNIEVNVLLEDNPFGGGGLSPREVMDRLEAAGVNVQTTNPEYALTHTKTMVIDEERVYIMTSNFSKSAFGSGSGAKNREYGIISSNAEDVQAVLTIFQADWDRTTPQYDNPNLVVSPINSRQALTDLMNSAQETLYIEAEYMHDEGMAQVIADVAARGVDVQLILPDPKDAYSGDNEPQNKEEVALVTKNNGQIKASTGVYMHAKLIIVDSTKAYVGSINFTPNSLDKNREIGIIIADTNAIQILQETFQEDWREGETYKV